MRKTMCKLSAIGGVVLAFLCVLIVFALFFSPVFERGESYEFYMGANSSSLTVRSKNPALDKLLLPSVAGESVRYRGDRKDALLKKFRAEVLFEEEVDGVVNYYCHSPLLKKGVLLNGYTVNLHIALSKEQTAAGTPLIFGGF